MRNPAQTGFVLIDKPMDCTSHDVVDSIRQITGVKKVGHTGTLDPIATGLLIVLIGKAATKLTPRLIGMDKEYRITMEFGYQTDSLDRAGKITNQLDPTAAQLSPEHITSKRLTTVLTQLTGTYAQTTPWFSAVKVGGQKLYQIARQSRKQPKELNADISPPQRIVSVYSLELIELKFNPTQYPQATLHTKVSSGTYTRALVKDIGDKLGVPTTQTALQRTVIGPFSLSEAKPLAETTIDDIIPLDKLLRRIESPKM